MVFTECLKKLCDKTASQASQQHCTSGAHNQQFLLLFVFRLVMHWFVFRLVMHWFCVFCSVVMHWLLLFSMEFVRLATAIFTSKWRSPTVDIDSVRLHGVNYTTVKLCNSLVTKYGDCMAELMLGCRGKGMTIVMHHILLLQPRYASDTPSVQPRP